MGAVLAFASREKLEQHGAGIAFCMGCKHEWAAVVPIGQDHFECPACARMMGRWRFEFAPRDGTLVRKCNCGNQYFYLTTEGHLCVNCGTYQQY
jgi:hypothetical protein